MFEILKPTQMAIERKIAAASALPAECPRLLTLVDGCAQARLPSGFVRDFRESVIAHGEEGFRCTRDAFAQWLMFDLGWVRVANPGAKIAPDELVAIEAHTAGLWTLNVSRIAETVDSSTSFGFLYETTRMHVEEGQERFLLNYDGATGEVVYLLEAVSRPRHALARVGWPLTRAFQHRFARDSFARMSSVAKRNRRT